MFVKRISIQKTTVSLLASVVITALAVLFGGDYAAAQSGGTDVTITPETQLEIIDSVTAVLNDQYVFADVAKNMEKHIREIYKKGGYKEYKNLRDFAEKLGEDLREICHDGHLQMAYLPNIEDYIGDSDSDTLTTAQRQTLDEKLRKINYDFEKIEILSGNIGYLKFNGFRDAELAGATAVAAMNFLANCDALIIDLRDNGGGSPSMIQLISTYFFNNVVHLNDFYIRKGDSTQQFYTLTYVPGPSLADVDLYVLTSSYTFSGAEEFSYNMKNLKRAAIIGETTGGGAHPVDDHLFNNLKIGLRVPYGMAVNPITHTNWEGVGVEPDIKCPANQALDIARTEALKKLLARTTDEERIADLQWDYDMLTAITNPAQVDVSVLNLYVGNYGPRRIFMEDGTLYYQREGRPVYRLIPMSNDTFFMKEVEYFKMTFEKDDNGNVIGILGQYKGGNTDRSPRDKQIN